MCVEEENGCFTTTNRIGHVMNAHGELFLLIDAAVNLVYEQRETRGIHLTNQLTKRVVAKVAHWQTAERVQKLLAF